MDLLRKGRKQEQQVQRNQIQSPRMAGCTEIWKFLHQLDALKLKMRRKNATHTLAHNWDVLKMFLRKESIFYVGNTSWKDAPSSVLNVQQQEEIPREDILYMLKSRAFFLV